MAVFHGPIRDRLLDGRRVAKAIELADGYIQAAIAIARIVGASAEPMRTVLAGAAASLPVGCLFSQSCSNVFSSSLHALLLRR